MIEALRAGLAAFGTWGAPPDPTAKIAVVLAVGFVVLGTTRAGKNLLGVGPEKIDTRLFLWLTAFASALLSIHWIAHYLRGGPRIVDASTYFLQGRALSHGELAWPVESPTASFRGRFLDHRPNASGDGGTLGGIFPPGYPLLLAFGFLLRAPMLVGPLLAGALVFATYRLARTFVELSSDPSFAEPVARTAALLSLTSAALRYHTADTMSHGATALFVALALDASLRARRHGAFVAALFVGAAFATRPVSAVPITLVSAFVLAQSLARSSQSGPRKSIRAWRLFAFGLLGLLPGVALLLASQKAVTGSWFASTQRMYYALSDGPPDCFRWGIGRGIGCLYEHGEFVAARLPHGYGLAAMAGTTLRRLCLHLADVANFEPLFALVFVPLILPKPTTAITRPERAAFALIVLHVIAYAPFYFDGNYPGGGARFFADVLPVEHALLAWGIALLVRRFLSDARALPHLPLLPLASFVVLGVALAGFGVHRSFDHLSLARRDGGRPMFEPDVLTHAKITTGLVFVDTDHGFSLGHDPTAHAKDGVLVARLRHDDRDRLLFEREGRPPTYLYRFLLPTPSPNATPGAEPDTATASVVPWTPPPFDRVLHFEAEAEWPVLASSGGFAVPAYVDTCASGSRALVLTPIALDTPATAALEIPLPGPGRYEVAGRVVIGAHAPFTEGRFAERPENRAEGVLEKVGETSISSRWAWSFGSNGCVDLPTRVHEFPTTTAHFVLTANGGPVALDRLTLKKIEGSP